MSAQKDAKRGSPFLSKDLPSNISLKGKETLANYLKKVQQSAKGLSSKDAADMSMQILSAVETLHQQGYVHLELTPNNIYILQDKPLHIVIDTTDATKLTNGTIPKGTKLRGYGDYYPPGLNKPDLSRAFPQAIDTHAYRHIVSRILDATDNPHPDLQGIQKIPDLYKTASILSFNHINSGTAKAEIQKIKGLKCFGETSQARASLEAGLIQQALQNIEKMEESSTPTATALQNFGTRALHGTRTEPAATSASTLTQQPMPESGEQSAVAPR